MRTGLATPGPAQPGARPRRRPRSPEPRRAGGCPARRTRGARPGPSWAASPLPPRHRPRRAAGSPPGARRGARGRAQPPPWAALRPGAHGLAAPSLCPSCPCRRTHGRASRKPSSCASRRSETRSASTGFRACLPEAPPSPARVRSAAACWLECGASGRRWSELWRILAKTPGAMEGAKASGA